MINKESINMGEYKHIATVIKGYHLKDLYIFWPIGIIEGELFAENNVFIGKDGVQYNHLNMHDIQEKIKKNLYPQGKYIEEPIYVSSTSNTNSNKNLYKKEPVAAIISTQGDAVYHLRLNCSYGELGENAVKLLWKILPNEDEYPKTKRKRNNNK